MPTPTERLHAWLRSRREMRTFTWITRILLAIGFIPPGLTKVMGEPFTILDPDSPIGSFLEAFFQSGGYYAFVGAAQMLAGALLLVPATCLVGALLYLPVIANIFVITATMGFRGTWIIAGLMLCANLYLLFWDLHRLRPLLWRDAERGLRQAADEPDAGRLTKLAVLASAALAGGAGYFLLAGRGLVPGALAVPFLGFSVAVFPLAAAAWWEALKARFGGRADGEPAEGSGDEC